MIWCSSFAILKVSYQNVNTMILRADQSNDYRLGISGLAQI
jgi:hypothetical protein